MFGHQQQRHRRRWLPSIISPVIGSLFLAFLFANPNLTATLTTPLSKAIGPLVATLRLQIPRQPAPMGAGPGDSAAGAHISSDTTTTVISFATIDYTEDVKAMGYPDGRKIVRDRAGHLYVAYRKKYKLRHSTAYHIFVAKSIDNGQSWVVTNGGKPIETTGDANQRVPAIAIDRQDVLHVVWYGQDDPYSTTNADLNKGRNLEEGQRTASANQIKYVHSDNHGSTWSTWQNIGNVPGYQGEALWQEHPTIYIGQTPTGAIRPVNHVDSAAPTGLPDPIYVVWEGPDTQYQAASQVKFVKSRDGGHSWSPWQNIAPALTNHSRPTLVGSAAGELYIFAYGRLGQRQQILYTQSSDDGATWRGWQAVAPTMVDQRHVSATVDGTGTLHIAWRQRLLLRFPWQADNPQIYYATYNGQLWSGAQRVHPDLTVAQTFPSVSTDGQGLIWLAWSETTESDEYPNDTLQSGTIYFVTKQGTTWDQPRPLVPPGRQAHQDIYASLARPIDHAPGNQAGLIDVVWLNNSQTTKGIQFAQLDCGCIAHQALHTGQITSQSASPQLEPVAVAPFMFTAAQFRPRQGDADQSSQESLLMQTMAMVPIQSMYGVVMRALPSAISCVQPPSTTQRAFQCTSTDVPATVILYGAELLHFVQSFWNRAISREFIALFFILIIVTLYVLLKFIVARWKILDTVE